MTSAEILKNILRELKSDYKEKLKELEIEQESLIDTISDIEADAKVNALLKFTNSIEMQNRDFILSLTKGENGLRVIELLNQLMDIQVSKEKFYRDLKETQDVINAFETNKAKNPVDINFLLSILTLVHDHFKVPIEALCECFGMVVYVNNKTIEKGKIPVLYPDVIEVLAKYFNPDGTFKFNPDVDSFNNAMQYLGEKNVLELLTVGISTESIAPSFVSLLEKSNESLREESVNESSSVEVKTVKRQRDNEAWAKLKEYYKNGTLIKTPDNLEEFKILLERCNIDTQEKRYILSLIKPKLKIVVDPIEIHLSCEQSIIYNKAKEILSTIDYRDPDYYMINDTFGNLNAVCELLDESLAGEDREYVLANLNLIMDCLKEFCIRHGYVFNEDSQNETHVTPNNITRARKG